MADPIFRRLLNATMRKAAAALCADLPAGWSVTFRPPRRSDAQNAKMHAMAKDLSDQVPWCGQRLSVEQWKRFATAKLKKDLIVFDCDEFGQPSANAGLVVLAAHTREMGTTEVGAIIDWFYWMGAQHKVAWKDEAREPEPAR